MSRKVTAWTSGFSAKDRTTITVLRYCKISREIKPFCRPVEHVEVIAEINLDTASQFALSQFFKKISKYCANLKDQGSYHTQFSAVTDKGDVQFIKWFWISCPDQAYCIKHDSAFDTILVVKEYASCSIALTSINLSRNRFKTCKHAYAKNKRDAYKIMANLVNR